MTKVEVIAEIGKNFITNEREEPIGILLNRAKELTFQAKEAGVDTVKFQTHSYEDEMHPNAKLVSPHFNQDRLTWVKRNTYPASFWAELADFCREIHIDFLSTPMSRGAAILLDEVGVDRWKIGSGDILDFVMLDYIRDTNKPIILSSGMSSFEELEKSYDFLKEKANNITILHCISQYPCPLDCVNLKTISYLKKKFLGTRIGFSDHSLGLEASLMAVSLGAEVIEKHFSLDREAWGSDHKVSVTPIEMKELVRRIRANDLVKPTDEALGVATKYLHGGEVKFRQVFRKGLYCARDIRRGELVEPDMLYALRPKLPNVLPSEEYVEVVGSVTQEDFKKYDPIKI